MVGRQTPILAVFVPLILVLMVDGRRGVRQTWLAALVGGVAFGVAQFLCSNFFSYQVADIIAALAGALALVLLLRVWQPSQIVSSEGVLELHPVGPPCRIWRFCRFWNRFCRFGRFWNRR